MYFTSQSLRPLSSGQVPASNNRKERERERDRETKDLQKITREHSPLDHRGEPTESIDKKSTRRSLTREHSNNASSKNELRSPCLLGVIYPLILEVTF